MKDDAAAAERLRERFVSPPEGLAVAAGCPDPDRIWRAAHAELPWPEVEALLDHAASCPACALAWRMAREQARADGVPPAVALKPRDATRWGWIRYAAAAAVVVVAAGLVFQKWYPRETEGPALRTTGQNAILSAIPDGGELSRSAFLLRWTPGPPGIRYSIQVTDERLATLAEAASLDRPEFRVPEPALSALGPEARILWQVKAIYPDGTRVTSDTFVALVGRSASP
jgi:hypothetical protein